MPLELYNHGASTRDFVHLKDVAQAIFLAMTFDFNQLCVDVQVLNIGPGQRNSVLEIANLLLKIAKAAGSSSELILREARDEEIAHSPTNAEKAKSILNWHPQERLENHLPFIFESILALSRK